MRVLVLSPGDSEPAEALRGRGHAVDVRPRAPGPRRARVSYDVVLRDGPRRRGGRRHGLPVVVLEATGTVPVERLEQVLDDAVRRAAARRPVVALVGPRPDSQGGVGAMVRLIGQSGLGSGYRLVTIPTYRDGTRRQKAVQAAAGLTRLAWLSAGRRVDLVHLHASWDASFTRKAIATAISRAAGRPVVLHVHGGRLEAEMSRPGLRGAARRRVVRWTLSHSQAVVALTPGWAEQLGAAADVAALHVVPNAPDLAAPAQRNGAAATPTILFLGHLYPEKGVIELVEALARLRDGRPGLRVVMAGRGTEGTAIRAAAAARGLPPEAVVLPGWVGPERKAALLGEAACFALPSYTEGLPLALLEAMAAGVPCVATSVGGIPEVVRDGVDGLLIPPRDVDALAAALARLLDDPAGAAAMGESARERAQAEYSSEALARRVGAIYDDVLEAR